MVSTELARAPPAPAHAGGDNFSYRRTTAETAVEGANFSVKAACSGSGNGDRKSEAGSVPSNSIVVEQLCRVVAGCSQLLRLRGVVGEREERALSVMSARGSPVLLAAVEAYGTNQDLEVQCVCLNVQRRRLNLDLSMGVVGGRI